MDPPPELTWRVHLARRQPSRAVLVGALVLAVPTWAAFSLGSPAAGPLTALLLLGAVAEYLFPVTYRLNGKGAEARGLLYWRQIEWREVKRVRVGEQEIRLSPLAHGGPRESFRGVVLRHDGTEGDTILAAIRQFRHAAAGD